MSREEFEQVTGLDKVPPYWDVRYTKNLDKLSKPQYTITVDNGCTYKIS